MVYSLKGMRRETAESLKLKTQYTVTLRFNSLAKAYKILQQKKYFMVKICIVKR